MGPCSKTGLAAVAFLVTGALPVLAQTPSGVQVGRLSCEVAPNVAFIIGSVREMTCTFAPAGQGRLTNYTGEIRRYGLDIGFNGKGKLLWNVFAATAGVQPASLRGSYLGASGDASVGAGVGGNVLVGGSGHSITLQPVSIEARTGVNLGLGVSKLTLN